MPENSFNLYYRRPSYYMDDNLIMPAFSMLPIDLNDNVGLSLIKDPRLTENMLKYIEKVSRGVKFDILG